MNVYIQTKQAFMDPEVTENGFVIFRKDLEFQHSSNGRVSVYIYL